MAHHDLEVEELAAWLTAQGPDSYWSVDGEEVLGGRLSMPCSADDLAEALRSRGGRVRIYEARGVNVDEPISRANLEALAEVDDGARAFELAWPEGSGAGDRWLLVEDTITKAGTTGLRDHAHSPN